MEPVYTECGYKVFVLITVIFVFLYSQFLKYSHSKLVTMHIFHTLSDPFTIKWLRMWYYTVNDSICICYWCEWNKANYVCIDQLIAYITADKGRILLVNWMFEYPIKFLGYCCSHVIIMLLLLFVYRLYTNARIIWS